MTYRIALAALLAFSLVGHQSTTRGIEDADLKKMLTALGYKPDESAGIFEVDLKTDKLDIPTRVFLSKSKLKLWISTTVMKDADVAKLTRDQAVAMLEKNVDIGPAHFMIEDDYLKIKMPVDNRGIDQAMLKNELTYFAEQVATTKELWFKKR
jgi:hypothetical protein